MPLLYSLLCSKLHIDSTNPTKNEMKKLSPSQILMGHLEWSIHHLADALKRPATEYYQNAALQRLSFTFELTIKTICAYAKEQEKTISGGNEALKYAQECQWIDEPSEWETILVNVKLMNDVKASTHTQYIYAELPRNHAMFETVFKHMQKTILPEND